MTQPDAGPHRDLFVVDGHADTLYRANRQGRDWDAPCDDAQTDFPRFVAGGVNLQVFALFSAPNHKGDGYALKALEMIHRFYGGFERIEAGLKAQGSPFSVGCVRQKEDVAKARGGFWGLLSIEGGEAIGRSLSALESFYRFGVRAMGLVWNHRNELADGVADGASGGGLTPFGRDVVRHMHAWGMLIDVSHLSDSGFWDVVRIAEGPIYASHSNARKLCNHPRNLTDEQLRAVAATGGVIGVNFCDDFLAESKAATIDHVVDHIAYMCDVAGPDHVGLGTDYDGIDTPPKGLEDVSRLPLLARALLARGFDDTTVRAVMGENLARLFSSVLP